MWVVIRETSDIISADRVQELCESQGGRPRVSVLMSLSVSVDESNTGPCFGIGHSLNTLEFCHGAHAGLRYLWFSHRARMPMTQHH